MWLELGSFLLGTAARSRHVIGRLSVRADTCYLGSIQVNYIQSVQSRVHWIQNSDDARESMTRTGIGLVAIK